MPQLTQARLRAALEYNPRTGVFTWRATNRRRKAGEVAGTIGPKGYVLIGLGGDVWQAHRLAWLWVHGAMPVEMDHLNGFRSDNRIVNLRPATRQLNMQNRRFASVTNRSGLLGVSWGARQGKWYARITTAGKTRHLGYFGTPGEAYAAYVAAKHKLHAGCSLPNFEALDRALTQNRE